MKNDIATILNLGHLYTILIGKVENATVMATLGMDFLIYAANSGALKDSEEGNEETLRLSKRTKEVQQECRDAFNKFSELFGKYLMDNAGDAGYNRSEINLN